MFSVTSSPRAGAWVYLPGLVGTPEKAHLICSLENLNLLASILGAKRGKMTTDLGSGQNADFDLTALTLVLHSAWLQGMWKATKESAF